MKNHTREFQILRHEAEAQFAYLEQHGFRFLDEEAEDDSLLVRVVIAGQRVALSISLDRRDDGITLRVAKMAGGHPDLPTLDLFGYLRRFCGYRGGFADGMTAEQVQKLSVEERISRAVRWYSRAVRELAPRIVNDTEDFNPRVPL